MRKAIKHMGGIIRPTLSGKWQAEVNFKYRRLRDTLPSVNLAMRWIEACMVQLGANRAGSLTSFDLIDAGRAMTMLPDGVTLCDAAKAYVEARGGSATRRPLKSLVEEWLDNRERSGLRPATLYSYRFVLGQLVNQFGEDAQFDSFGAAELVGWMHSGGVCAATARLRKHILNVFMNWCVDMRYYGSNPAASLPGVCVDETPIGIFTVEEARKVMSHLAKNRPELVSHFAIAFFAGLRSSELAQLTTDAIGKEQIVVDSKIAKKRRQGLVDIRPNLRAWLDAYPPAAQRVSQDISRVVVRNVFDKCNLGRVRPHNGARHSFASYLYASTHDAAYVISQLRHGGSVSVFLNHYRALATKEDGERYFSISPSSVPSCDENCTNESHSGPLAATSHARIGANSHKTGR